MDLYENRKKMVLIVDDNPKNIQVLGSILRNENYGIGYTTKPLEVFDIVKKSKFDLILLDIMMPEMDGYEVCQKLKEDNEFKEIPIIFLTAKVDAESVVKGFEIGGQDYVTKPFNSSELLARVKTHIELKEKTAILKSLNDILKQKVAERTKELQDANKELIKLAKVKNDFLNMLTYETNTQNGICKIETIFEEFIKDKETSKIDKLKESTNRLLRFSEIANLITSLKSNNYKMNSNVIFLNELISKTITESKKCAEDKNKHLSFELNIDESVRIWGDSELIKKSLSVIFEQILCKTGSNKVHIKLFQQKELKIIELSYKSAGFDKEIINCFENKKDDIDISNIPISLWFAKIIQDFHNGNINLSNKDEYEVITLTF